MNIDMLRKWVRDELDPLRRREVGRWMLRCSDPQVPEIMHGLVREYEEEIADIALRTRAPGRSFVADLWHRLLESGRAGIESLRPPALVGGAVLGSATAATGLAFREIGEEVIVDLLITQTASMIAVFATTDLGDEHLLLKPTPLIAGTYADVTRWTPESSEGRITIWLVLAPLDTDTERLQTLLSVKTLVELGTADVIAARWSNLA